MKKYNFKTTLLLLFLLCVMIPMILSSLVQLAYFNKRFLKETNKQFDNTLYSVSKNLQIYLEHLKYLSLVPLLNDDIKEYMTYLNEADKTQENDRYNRYHYSYMYSKTIQKLLYSSPDGIKGVLFIPTDNETSYFVSRYKASINEVPGYKAATQERCSEAVQANGQAVLTKIHTVPYYDNQPVFSVSRLIKDIDRKKDIGIIKVDASASFIKDIFDNIEISPNSVLMLVDEDKNIVYSTSGQSKQLLENYKNSTGNLKFNKDTYYVTTSDVPETPWKFIYFTSKNDVTQQTSTIFCFSIVCFFLCLIVSYLLFKINSKKIVTKVQAIIKGMHQIEKGDLDARIEVDCAQNDDLSKIAKAFNSMTEQLKLHIDKEYRATLSQKAAEYAALQSQINPHFLNNILNGFVTLNRLGARDILEESIISLTRLYRYTCNKQNSTTVKQELTFIEQYFYLQKLRFEDRLQYEITIDPAAADIKIPKLLIQPLTENSIVHGMEPCNSLVTIRIQACKTAIKGLGDCLLLIVADNGAGFDINSLAMDKRVGLKSTQERLELFNSESVFLIKSSQKEGTTCFILMKV